MRSASLGSSFHLLFGTIVHETHARRHCANANSSEGGKYVHFRNSLRKRGFGCALFASDRINPHVRAAGEAAECIASSTRPGGCAVAVLHAIDNSFRLASSKAHLLPMDSVEAATKAGRVGVQNCHRRRQNHAYASLLLRLTFNAC